MYEGNTGAFLQHVSHHKTYEILVQTSSVRKQMTFPDTDYFSIIPSELKTGSGVTSIPIISSLT